MYLLRYFFTVLLRKRVLLIKDTVHMEPETWRTFLGTFRLYGIWRLGQRQVRPVNSLLAPHITFNCKETSAHSTNLAKNRRIAITFGSNSEPIIIALIYGDSEIFFGIDNSRISQLLALTIGHGDLHGY